MSVRVVLLVLLAFCVASPASATEIDRLAGVRTFALALGDGAADRDLSGYDLVVVDSSTSATRVKQLRAGGSLVLGYLSLGTIEPYRSWYRAAKPYRLDYWPDWGEWYANVARPGFRDLIAKRVAPAIMGRGFDGLFFDNVDMVEAHPKQKAGMLALVRRLAARRGYYFAQNGDDVIDPFLKYLDGWNREDVSRTYDFDTKRYVPVGAADRADAVAALRRIGARVRLVTATDYVAASDSAGAASATRTACDAGALSYVSDIELRRVPRPAPHC
jgi:uncharacterized protein (TIGR01370 family)